MSSPGYLSSPRTGDRPSSRSSLLSVGRSSSPVFADDNVAIRTQISTLRHSIRHQQAQLHTLENVVLRGPRPLPPGILGSPPLSPSELDPQPSYTTPRLQKRHSYEILQGLAGPDSNLPLPRRDERRLSFGEENGIREGIPTGSSFGKRAASPTRTLSRIPVSSVGNARALAEEGPSDGGGYGGGLSAASAATPASSPNRRASVTPGSTTRVLADLQAGVRDARGALENTRAQLRVSQRQVSQLTRLTEDLKDVRERLRLENEGLNNVVARKERLLQEVLDRARKAEAEVITLKSQLKQETTVSKKSIREMESTLTESTAKSQKAEREYIVLRDSLKGLAESFQADQAKLREEMSRREAKVRSEAEELSKKYNKLVEDVRKEREAGAAGEVRRLKEENERIRREMEESFRQEIAELRTQMDKTTKDNENAWKTAQTLAAELAWLRRLMRESAPSASPSGEIDASTS
ncbi:hypothetical protein CERSUDRAFT_112900 [Gelatoporia subvermispora B]|uniref:SWI5-dependent HO expression protein 3 n=1 Tax=Ceriporiopsis subvermispora (strain B) TaxID=914234 RepID=M2PRJ9_CERS8|nr:hypothetical protein CERSUDRAFT_112900 [Gelatoporia subvermispora B]